MTDFATTINDGAQIDLASLPTRFEYDGNLLSSATVESPPSSGTLYKKSFSYAAGFSLASITVDTPGSFRNVTISTSGPGSGATFVPTYGLFAPNSSGMDGTGYTAGDLVTIVGGVGSVAAQVSIDAVDGGGAVTSMSLQLAGVYTTLPVGPVAVTGGSGTDLVIDPYWTFLTIGLGHAGAGYDDTSELVFGGDLIVTPAATLVLSSVDTGGNMVYATGWERQP